MTSYLRGIARLLDFTGSLSDYSALRKTDADAIRSDWQAVGDDMRRAMADLDAPTHCPTCSKPVDADSGWCAECGER